MEAEPEGCDYSGIYRDVDDELMEIQRPVEFATP
jgi:hypothetical protein